MSGLLPAKQKDLPDVRVGQVWADNDKRSKGREVTIVEIIEDRPGNDPHAIVEVTKAAAGAVMVDPKKPRRTRVAVRRFVPNSTGYRLVQDTLE